MIPDDEPTGQPPDSVEAINTYVVNETTLKNKTTTFDMPSNTSLSTKNGTISEGKETKIRKNDLKLT